MPALRNPRHERFCQAYVRGGTAGNAAASYKAAFGKDNRAQASRLQHDRNILQRVAELQAQVSSIEARALEKAVDRLAITKEAVLAELARMGFANMLDYVRIRDDGEPMIDLSALNRDRAAAIQEVVVDSYTDGRGDDSREVKRIRFKLADKQAALVSLGKHLGMFVERQRIPAEHADKTDDQLRDELERIDRQLAELGVDGGEALDQARRPAAGEPK